MPPKMQSLHDLRELNAKMDEIVRIRRQQVEKGKSQKNQNALALEKIKTKNDALVKKIKELNEVEAKLGIQRSKKTTERKLQNLRRKLDDMKSKTQKRRQQMNNLIERQNEISGGTNLLGSGDLSNDDHPIMKQIRIVGNRLDKVMIKYNEALDMKKTYTLLHTKLADERLTYERQLQQIEGSLKNKSFDMAEMIRLSEQAQKAKDQALKKLKKIETNGIKGPLNELSLS